VDPKVFAQTYIDTNFRFTYNGADRPGIGVPGTGPDRNASE
jgi:hypothetical protein